MPRPKMSLRRLAYSRPDLPRPVGLEVARNRSITIYLPDLSAFEAWRGALERSGDIAEAYGWRYIAGYLKSGDEAALTTLMVRFTEGTER
jgi:hypothetical protein